MKWLPALLLGLLATCPPRLEADPVDYLRDVKPILAKHCASCHGAAKPKGGLRLDTAAAALEGGDNGPAVVPGKADESLLLDAVTGDGGIERMPLKRPPLSDEQIATLRAWIDQGAEAPAAETPEPGGRRALGLRPAATAGRAAGRGRGLGPQPDRPLHPRPAREGGHRALARGRPRDAPPPASAST